MNQITDEDWQNMSPEERIDFQKKNCVFCKIIAGELNSKKIYEDKNFIGVLDIYPVAKGHVLVLPKNHVQIMPQLGTELNGELGIVSKRISEKIKKSLGVSSTTLFVANGNVAGQNAPHFMMHIIPRTKDDKLNFNPDLKKFNESKINSLRLKMIKHLGIPDLTKGKENKVSVVKNESKNIDAKRDLTKKSNHEAVPQDNDVDVIKTDSNANKDLFDKISKMFK